MSNNILPENNILPANSILPANIFDNCGILFFILVFLLLFWGKGSKRSVTNEVE